VGTKIKQLIKVWEKNERKERWMQVFVPIYVIVKWKEFGLSTFKWKYLSK